jgi:mRNA-degrading endonuclease toxin of MazEF toxin-antitoxin module
MDDIDFDDWNRLKKSLESNIEGPNRFLKEGEAWMSLVGKNIGWEQNGTGIRFSRPVLILRVFNNHMFWAVPLSSRQKSLDFYFNFTDPLNQRVSAILAQMKLMSVKRLERKMYTLPQNCLLEIKDRLKKLIEN